MTAVPPEDIRLTRVKKAGLALLSKRITLGEDGRPVSDGSPCAMTNGTATRVALDWWSPARDLAALILDLGSHEALVLGDHVAQTETIEISKAAHAANGRYGRTLDTFKFKDGEPAVAVLDYDQKGISDSARAIIVEHGGFEGAITSLIPSYPSLARVVRASTSAGLRNEETGETFPGNGGLHVYLFARNGADIPRFLRDLQKRAWLNGLGWIMVSSRGSLLIRSIVDVTVGSPERLVFEGMPRVVAPLAQDQEARRPVAHEGDLLDIATTCPPLTPEEERQYGELVEAAKREKQPEVEAAKEQAAEKISALRGIDIEKARAVVAASTQGELWSWDVLHFDDETIGEVSVADVLADPERFHGETLADPIEGRSYGRGKAQVYWNSNNSVIINSFAHGGCKHTVCHDADYIEQKVEDAGEHAPFVLAALMAHAGNFDAVTKERLRNLAAKIGKVGKRAVGQTIKEAAQKAKRAAAAAARARGGDRGKGGAKPSREEIRCYGGSLPQNVADAERALGVATCREPTLGVYQRGGLLVRIARLPVATTADGIRRAAGSMQILPAGSDFLRLRLTEVATWLRLDKRSEEWVQTDAPAAVSRALADLAGMWPHTRNLAGVIEAPALRPDGSVLERPGFDPDSGLYLDPGSTEFPAIPERPTRRDAEVALTELLSIIAGFPFVDEASRSVALALLITPLIRYAVRAAPLTGISAPKMGSGKTLLSHLPAYIATGRSPALMAQADDPQEEKKRLLALLLEGSPVTVLDNCERSLKSDALCIALTEVVIRDRILGSTRTISVPTTTTWIATGNALSIDGDLSSRTLLCTLDPRCERPEEREFKVDLHADVPARRGEFAIAALTIVKAYLAADAPRPKIPTFGRFEAWSRFVREPLVWLSCTDPCETRRTIEARDPVRDRLGNLLEAWHAVFGDRAQTVASAIGETDDLKIAHAQQHASKEVTDKLRALRNALEAVGDERGKLNARRVGGFFAKHEGRIERGYRADQAGTRSHAVLWSVSYVSSVSCATTARGKCQKNGESFSFDSSSRSAGANSSNSSNSPNGTPRPGHALNKNGADPPSETPETLHSASNGANGTICVHCREPILPSDGFTATATEFLHNRCVDDWATAP